MFKRQKVVKKLSADELKSKLYAHFDKSGSLNQLRSQIRSQLASDLFKIAPPSTVVSEHNKKSIDLDNTLLPLQVCNWLVYDHLMKQGYQYTLSTFVSETNLPYPEKLLAVGDILALVGLDNSSPEYKRICDLYSTNKEREGLHSLLLAIIKSVIFASDKDNTQITNSFPEADIKSKLVSSIEKQEHINRSDTFSTSKIKEINEAASLESSYREQLQSIREEREREIQKLRHKLVLELDRLHSQEQLFLREIEQERKEIKKEKGYLFNEREKLKDKEGLFLKEQENKLEKKIREIEEVHAAKLYSKEKVILSLQEELKEKEKKFGHMEFELSTYRERLDTLKRELDDLNKMYKSVHEKYNSLLDENTNLVRKFESMSDYKVLKNELAARGREISILKEEIENLHRTVERNKKAYTDTVASLELKLKATEPKLHHIQKELNQARETLHMEETQWQKEKERLEQDSLTSIDLYKNIIQQIEEQKQDIHDLHQYIHTLQYQLTTGNINQASKSEHYDHLRTIPKVAFLPKNNRKLKPNKNLPVCISQQYKENALNIISKFKNRSNKLQREGDEGFDKYSLISHTSLDTKILNPFNNSSILDHSMKFKQPSFVKNIKSASSGLPLDTSLNFMTLGSLNLQHRNTKFPSLVSKNYSNQLNETAAIAQTNYDDTFPSQNKPTLKMFEPSTSLYNRTENFQNTSFLSSRTDQNRLDTNKTTSYSSKVGEETFISGLPENKDIPTAETSSTRISENTAEVISIEKKISTRITENTFQDIPTQTFSTKIIENAFKDISATETGVKQKSNYSNSVSPHLLPKELPFQNIDNSSTQPLLKTTFSETSSVPLNQVSSNNSQKQDTTGIIVDLDAAWKRKTSLPTVNPLFQSSKTPTFAKKTLDDIIIEKRTLQDGSISNHPDAVSDKIEQIIATSSNIRTVKNPDIVSSSVTYDQSIVKNSEQHIVPNEDQVSLSQEANNEAESINSSKSVVLNISSTDEERIENSKKEDVVKSNPEDSVSELSEVHLSCGSEQEEQKEESDNW